MKPSAYLKSYFAGVLGMILGCDRACGGDVVPAPGFDYDHYHALVQASPFSVATGDTATADEAYVLTGVAHFDGIDYVSIVRKDENERFLLWKGGPTATVSGSAGAMTLMSLSSGKTVSDTYAMVQVGAQTLRVQGKTVQTPVMLAAHLEQMIPPATSLYRTMVIPRTAIAPARAE